MFRLENEGRGLGFGLSLGCPGRKSEEGRGVYDRNIDPEFGAGAICDRCYFWRDVIQLR